jgi:hypothetical protein
MSRFSHFKIFIDLICSKVFKRLALFGLMRVGIYFCLLWNFEMNQAPTSLPEEIAKIFWLLHLPKSSIKMQISAINVDEKLSPFNQIV